MYISYATKPPQVTFYCPSGDGAGAPPEPEQAPAPAPAPAPPSPLEKKTKTPSECRHYIATTGCGWTSESSCPGQAAGKAGLARDDNSEGLACCCDLALWKGFPAEPTPLPSAPAPASQAAAPADILYQDLGWLETRLAQLTLNYLLNSLSICTLTHV